MVLLSWSIKPLIFIVFKIWYVLLTPRSRAALISLTVKPSSSAWRSSNIFNIYSLINGVYYLWSIWHKRYPLIWLKSIYMDHCSYAKEYASNEQAWIKAQECHCPEQSRTLVALHAFVLIFYQNILKSNIMGCIAIYKPHINNV